MSLIRRWPRHFHRGAHLRSRIGRAAAFSTASTALLVLSNVFAAVILSRVVSPSERGEYYAIVSTAPVVAWVAAAGWSQAISFAAARGDVSGEMLISTWIAVSIPVGAVAALGGEGIYQLTLHLETPHVRLVAALFMTCAGLFVISEAIVGFLIGERRYWLVGSLRAGQALAGLAAYGLLAAVGRLNVDTAVAATAGSWVLFVGAGLLSVRSKLSWRAINWAVARRGLWYAIRAHGATTAWLVALRLDAVLLPAYVSSAQLGMYAIATNVASVPVTVIGAASLVVLPEAARDVKRAHRIVWLSASAALALVGVGSVVLALTAPEAVSVVYGSPYASAADPLRILLPGAIALSGTSAFMNGLYSMNRPLTATMTQIPAAVVTIVGLGLLLPRGGGTTAAALTSSVAYILTFGLSVVLYTRVRGSLRHSSRDSAVHGVGN